MEKGDDETIRQLQTEAEYDLRSAQKVPCCFLLLYVAVFGVFLPRRGSEPHRFGCRLSI